MLLSSPMGYQQSMQTENDIENNYCTLFIAQGVCKVDSSVCVVGLAMVWTEKDIMAELENSSAFLMKKKSSSDDRIPEVEGTLVRGIVSKFGSIKVDAGVAMKLHEAVEAASGFGESSITQLKKSIDDCLTQIPGTVTTAVTRPQWINCSKYLTKADWEALASEPYHTKVSIITKRLRLLGVQSMAEQSIKFATACLLTTYTQSASSRCDLWYCPGYEALIFIQLHQHHWFTSNFAVP